MVPTQTNQNPACPTCACKLTVKKGVQRNRLQVLQVFRCTECLHRFTGAVGKNKTQRDTVFALLGNEKPDFLGGNSYYFRTFREEEVSSTRALPYILYAAPPPQTCNL
jgi:transposase-like protein